MWHVVQNFKLVIRWNAYFGYCISEFYDSITFWGESIKESFYEKNEKKRERESALIVNDTRKKGEKREKWEKNDCGISSRPASAPFAARLQRHKYTASQTSQPYNSTFIHNFLLDHRTHFSTSSPPLGLLLPSREKMLTLAFVILTSTLIAAVAVTHKSAVVQNSQTAFHHASSRCPFSEKPINLTNFEYMCPGGNKSIEDYILYGYLGSFKPVHGGVSLFIAGAIPLAVQAVNKYVSIV